MLNAVRFFRTAFGVFNGNISTGLDLRILFIASIVCLSLSARAASDVLFEDFESGAYAPKWTPEGDAFGKNPALGTFKGQHEVSGFWGAGLLIRFMEATYRAVGS